MNENGLRIAKSEFSVSEAIDRLSSLAASKGLLTFARIDHSANAKQIGMELRPTELLVFGHPKGGTPLMQDKQTAGLDLPVRAVAWEDADGLVWLSYDDPKWIAKRHGLALRSDSGVRAIEVGLKSLSEAATRSRPQENRGMAGGNAGRDCD